MEKIDFDGIKTRIKQNQHPLLSAVTVGDKVTFQLHESASRKRKSKKRKGKKRRHIGYLGAWCPWWVPPCPPGPKPCPGPEPGPQPGPEPGPTPGPAPVPAGGGDVGGMAGGGGMVGESCSGYVIGESAENGLFFESIDDTVGFMISSELIEVSPESAEDTKRMLKNGVADAIACYTPLKSKRHPFKVFKVSDVPVERINECTEIAEEEDSSEVDDSASITDPEVERILELHDASLPENEWYGKRDEDKTVMTPRGMVNFRKHSRDRLKRILLDKKESPDLTTVVQQIWNASGHSGSVANVHKWSDEIGYYQYPTNWDTKEETEFVKEFFRYMYADEPSCAVFETDNKFIGPLIVYVTNDGSQIDARSIQKRVKELYGAFLEPVIK